MATDKQKQGQANREWGKQAEDIAADYLTAEGYVIRERNWRCGNHIEIDIIAQEGTTIEPYAGKVIRVCLMTLLMSSPPMAWEESSARFSQVSSPTITLLSKEER